MTFCAQGAVSETHCKFSRGSLITLEKCSWNSWNTWWLLLSLEMCLKLMKLLMLLKRLKLKINLKMGPACAGAESNFEIQALLKHALETLERLDDHCRLLKFSWNALATLETLETPVMQTRQEMKGWNTICRTLLAFILMWNWDSFTLIHFDSLWLWTDGAMVLCWTSQFWHRSRVLWLWPNVFLPVLAGLHARKWPSENPINGKTLHEGPVAHVVVT